MLINILIRYKYEKEAISINLNDYIKFKAKSLKQNKKWYCFEVNGDERTKKCFKTASCFLKN